MSFLGRCVFLRRLSYFCFWIKYFGVNENEYISVHVCVLGVRKLVSAGVKGCLSAILFVFGALVSVNV